MQCIICLEWFPNTNLTDEHSIPLALGGRSKITNATCESCRNLTSREETAVLRGAFWAFRIVTGLPTRSKRALDKLPIFCIDGDESQRLSIFLDDYPVMLPFPKFGGAALLNDGVVDLEAKLPWFAADMDKVNEIFKKYKISSFSSMELNVNSFGKMLFKIAHCLAFERFGRGFSPYIRDVYFGKSNFNYLKYIGLADCPPKFFSKTYTHNCQFFKTERNGSNLLIARVGLFSNMGSPHYDVVVGECDGSFDSGPNLICEDIHIPISMRAEKLRVMFSESANNEKIEHKPDVFMNNVKLHLTQSSPISS